MIKTLELENGIRVVLEPMNHLRTVSFGVWVKVGSVNETKENNGISHVIEHCLFDKQRFICPSLKTIEDDERIGLLLRGHKIFMYKQDVKVVEVQDDTYVISDGRLAITVNKL